MKNRCSVLGNRAAVALHAGLRRTLAALAAYSKSRRGAAMTFTAAVVLLLMVVSGAQLSNYSWREAQWQELQSATRAAVAAAGPMLARAGTDAGNEEIRERVAEFITGLMPGLAVDADDVTVERDAQDVITVGVKGTYAFQDVFGNREGGTAETVTTAVRVKLEVDRYEVAVATDISHSMNFTLPGGGVTRLQALKEAFVAATEALREQTATSPGSMMVSVVPFSGAVNVADTCAANGGVCTNERTPAKERYVRMLAGGNDTMAQTLDDARSAVAANKRVHWVDTFRHYGMAEDSALTHRHLPTALLNDIDWNLRRRGVPIDVSAEVPSLGRWVVDDEDFWYGCVMARWGARWDPDARPADWDDSDPSTWEWPATKGVPAWSPRGNSLGQNTPLHLSDAPPVASDPNSLFTAYSWPDAGVAAIADEKLKGTQLEMMYPGTFRPNFLDIFSLFRVPGSHIQLDWHYIGDNHWSRSNNSGRELCPPSPIAPLTDDLDALQDTTNALQTDGVFQAYGTFGVTHIPRGVVWALRTLSPLWQDVWHVQDVGGRDRPGVPCAPNDTTNCDPRLRKAIFLLSDGANSPSNVGITRLVAGVLPPWTRNPEWKDGMCDPSLATTLEDYYDTAFAGTEDAFNDFFRAATVGADLVDAAGNLNADGIQRFAAALLAAEGTDCTTEAARCANMQATLAADPPTPWELFHSLDADVVDTLMGIDFFFAGRPTLVGHPCNNPISAFSVYGRVGDRVEVGELGAVAGESPLELASTRFANQVLTTAQNLEIQREMRSRMDDWLVEACRIAGLRRVRIHAIFIGGDEVYQAGAIDVLERCVDAAGGDPDEDEVHLVPTAEAIRDTIVNLFTVRRNLRFLD